MQQLIRVQSAGAGECDGLDRTRLHWAKQPLHPPAQASCPPFLVQSTCHCHIGFVAAPACCLVTGWSELDIIMTAMLIRPDPVFHLSLGPAQSEWLFEVRPGLSDEVNELRPNKQKTSKRSLCNVMKFV